EIEKSCELRQSIDHPGIGTWIFHAELQRKPLMRNAVSQRVRVKILANAGRRQKQHADRPLRRPIRSLYLDDTEVWRGWGAELLSLKIELLAKGFGNGGCHVGGSFHCVDGNLGLLRFYVRRFVFARRNRAPVRWLRAGVTIAGFRKIRYQCPTSRHIDS